jgi:hypothetical protein
MGLTRPRQSSSLCAFGPYWQRPPTRSHSPDSHSWPVRAQLAPSQPTIHPNCFVRVTTCV